MHYAYNKPSPNKGDGTDGKTSAVVYDHFSYIGLCGVVEAVGITDSPIIQRIAELRISQKARGLDQVQQKEMDLCLDWLVNKCWTDALLKNYSLMASMTNDVDWNLEICREIDEFGMIEKKKKPGHKDTD